MIGKTIKKMSSKFTGIYRALVVKNDDPKQLGRVKLRIHPMMSKEDIPIDALPWAVPGYPLFDGSGVGFGSFIVPRLETEVWVFFENSNPMMPVYFGEASNGKMGLPVSRITNYPDRKVWRTKSGIEILLDDTSGEELIKILHPIASWLEIDKDHIRAEHSSGSWIEIDGTKIKVGHSSGSYITIAADGRVTIAAPTKDVIVKDVEFTDTSIDLKKKQARGIVIDPRTSDPASPVTGQVWFRTDV